MNNQKLFMYGLGSNAVVFLGGLISFVGIGVLTLSSAILGFLILIIGVGLYIKGKAMRFNFKRKSGTIIHRGDW